MESGKEAMYFPRYPVVNKMDLTSLKECAALMGPIQRGSFDVTYGNLRKLLLLEVQTEAIVALSRFYDSQIRCFLFKNFPMTPTLEEYQQILGFTQVGVVPYRYQEQHYTDEGFAELLQVGIEDLKLRKQKRNNVIGFPQSYLEGLMGTYARGENWAVFKQVLALTIFGVILFPQIDGYVDVTVIGIFLAFQNEKNPINPIPAILADTYSAFTHHCALRKKKISCSSHMLYAWLLIHVFANSTHVERLIDYATTCEVKTMNTQEWIQTLRDLDGHSIRWYLPSCWGDRPKIIFSCVGFQNVPLMGTKGCINYNPSLALRQLGYPMRNAPTEEMLSPFYIYEGGPKDVSLIRKILQAWGTVTRKGKLELAQKAGDVTFAQWLEKRIQSVQLPYHKALPVENEVANTRGPVVEELDEVKLALMKAEEEKKSLQAEIEEMALKNKKLKEENTIKSATIEEISHKLKGEEKSKIEAQRYLQGAKEEIKRRGLKEKKALEEANQWKELFDEAKMEERTAKSLLAKSKRDLRMLQAEWEDKLDNVVQERNSFENILREYQRVLKTEQEDSDELKRNLRHISDAYRQVRDECQYWEHRYIELLGRIEEQAVIIELRDEVQYWKSRFSKLSELANQALADGLKNLKKAEAEMHPLNTPLAVYRFVEYCRMLIEEVKGKAGSTSASNKRRRNGEFKALCI